MTAAFLLPALLAAAPTNWHAIVVGNNTSPTQKRPTLAFADDDAIRYSLALSPVVKAERRTLLARVDFDSSRLVFAGVTPSAPPTLDALTEAFRTLSKRVEAERAQGIRSGLYFFFAGHGDVEQGKGFLEFEDGRLFGQHLRELIASTRVDETHVVLDSCNSVFVVSPRKPGGRRFSTPVELSAALTNQLPGIGVFLSSSGDAESWEWSELQSGVFSYLIRSGLAGPADLNGDLEISYSELRRFVAIAAQDVKNPRFRPVVYARGPDGRDDRPFMTLPADAPGLHLTSDKAEHIVIRDLEGTRWLEANVEAGQVFRLVVDASLVPILRVDRPGSKHVAFPQTLTSSLEALEAQTDPTTARGPAPSLAALFETPYGPDSVKAFDARGGDQATFGVSEREFVHLVGLIERLVANEKATREESIASGVAWGGAFTGIALSAIFTSSAPCAQWCDLRGVSVTIGAVGLFQGLEALATALDPPSSELTSLLRASRGELSQRERDHLAERAERRFLQEVRERRRSLTANRILWGISTTAMVALPVGLLLSDTLRGEPLNYWNVITSFVGLGLNTVSFILSTLRVSERDALMTEWLSERTQGRVQLGFAPTPAGAGGVASISGQF